MTDTDYTARWPLGSYNTKNYRLEGSTLTIEVLVWTGDPPEWLDSSIDLNQYLGVEDGILVLGKSGLFDTTLEPAPFLEVDEDLEVEVKVDLQDENGDNKEEIKVPKNPQFLRIKEEEGWRVDLTRILFIDRGGHVDFKKL
jgi:hypothetical protein